MTLTSGGTWPGDTAGQGGERVVRLSFINIDHRQELNVSFLKGQKYKLQNKVDSIKNDVTVRTTQWVFTALS